MTAKVKPPFYAILYLNPRKSYPESMGLGWKNV